MPGDPMPMTVSEAEVEAAVIAYNEVWNGWGGIDASNVDGVRKIAMRAALRAAAAVRQQEEKL